MKTLCETVKDALLESAGPKVGDIGNWHGESATVLYTDEDEVSFIIGTYRGKEFQDMLQKFEAEDAKFWDKYGDSIENVSIKDWKKQQ